MSGRLNMRESRCMPLDLSRYGIMLSMLARETNIPVQTFSPVCTGTLYEVMMMNDQPKPKGTPTFNGEDETQLYWQNKYTDEHRKFFGAWLQLCFQASIGEVDGIDCDDAPEDRLIDWHAAEAGEWLCNFSIDVSKCVTPDDVFAAVEKWVWTPDEDGCVPYENFTEADGVITDIENARSYWQEYVWEKRMAA